MIRLNRKSVHDQYSPQLDKLLDEINPEVVHIHNGYYRPHRDAAKKAKEKGMAVVHTWHGGAIKDEDEKDPKKREIQGRLHKIHNETAELADYNIGISETGKKAFDNNEDVLSLYGVDLKHFNPNKVSDEDIRSSRENINAKDDDFVFFFPGRYHTQKNQHGLLKAFARVSKDNPEAKLVLAGQKFDDENGKQYLDQLNKLVNDYNLEDKVVMMDKVESRDDMRNLYAASDAVIYPSTNEGRGRSLIEAMAMKKPVLASQDAGLKDSLQAADGSKGLLFDPDSIDDIINNMNKIMTNDTLRKDMSVKAREYAVNNLSIKPYANQYHKLYKKLVAEKT